MQATTFAQARRIAPYHPKLNLLISVFGMICKPRDSHGSESHFRAEGSHISRWNGSDHIEKENSQKRVPPSKVKQCRPKHAYRHQPLNNVISPSEKLATVKFALIQTEKLSYGCYWSVRWSGKRCLIRPFVRKNSFNTLFLQHQVERESGSID